MKMHFINSWTYLLIAIPFGVLGTISMKLSHGLRKWKPSVSLLIFYLISFAALTMALQGIPLSIVYAVWSGVGTIFVAILSRFMFEESFSLMKIISLLLIVAGVIGIHLSNGIQ
ncbi:MAG: DMT family transporter [Gammaproteobacteria bacterium]